VELQGAKQRFEQQGIKLAAISYDSQAILKDFADRHKIEFPLLADPDSKIIRSFHVLNESAAGKDRGMAHPGFFYIDSTGTIREKYFEAKYSNRFTPNNVMGKIFPELEEEVSQNVDSPHLHVTFGQSDRTVVAGSRVTLTADIKLPPDVHVYAQGTPGYRPIQLLLQTSGEVEADPAVYPASQTLFMEAIQEKVPVFEGKFRITQDVTVNFSKIRDGLRAVRSSEKTITIAGELKYQACGKTVCYPPASIPAKWQLEVLPLDLKRSPEGIRHH
jgi:hypothetical protein